MPPPGRKSSGKQKARVEDSDSEGDDGRLPKYENIQPEYLNQSIDSKVGETKLKSLITDLAAGVKELKESAKMMIEVAADLASSLSQPGQSENLDYDNLPEDPEEIKTLDAAMRSVLDKLFELDVRSKALSDLRQKLAQGHKISDIFGVYEKAVEAPLAEYENKTSRQRYMSNKRYTGFRELVFENLYDGRAPPNIKKIIPPEADDDDESDDELEIGAQGTDFKCPITMTLLQDPVTSKKCPHSYSHQALRETFEQQRIPVIHCPATGCPQKISLADVEPNENLKRRVEAFAERQKRDKENGGPGTQKGKTATQYEVMSDSDDE